MLNVQKVCPACGAALGQGRRWAGLVQRLGPSCPACGVALLFDTAGGVYLKPTLSDEPPDAGVKNSPKATAVDENDG